MSELESIVPHPSLEEECQRNPELKISDLDLLRDWLKKQPHLPKIPTFMLIQFLHTNYYRIEPTKQLIEDFFTLKTHAPEIFFNRDPTTSRELQKIFNCIEVIALEQKTAEDYTMMYCKFRDKDPSQYILADGFKYLTMILELHLIMNGTNNGVILIFDAKGLSFGHVACMDLMVLKKIVYLIQTALPARLQGIYILNTIPAMEILLDMIKPFTNAKWRNKLQIHSSIETVRKFLPVEAFAYEDGGKAGLSKELAAKGIQLLQKYRKWFQYSDNLRVNETLRVGNCKTAEDLFGVDGSFRKLDID